MVALRKQLAGSDSFGNVWATDGAIIDVPPEQALILLRIPDGGFEEVTAESPTSRPPPKGRSRTFSEN